MKIKTGTGTIPLASAVAILSLSLVVNLPGLAVSPMLGTLEQVFPRTTQLEEQLLTLLPNLLIIPCVLLGGRLSVSGHKRAIITMALVLYAASGVAYLFAGSMSALIVISCCLGMGAGLLIPFSTGLIADVYTGSYRMKQMGLQSGISNMTLVFATLVVGWLSSGDWHRPFLVYLIPLVPLALMPFLKGIPQPSGGVRREKRSGGIGEGMSVGRVVATMAVYFFFTFAVIIISYYAPFVAEKEHLSSEFTGAITSVFFLFVFLPGFFLSRIVRALGQSTMLVCALLVFAGLGIFAFFPHRAGMLSAAVLMGIGYGIVQPLLYDKATQATTDPTRATLVLSFVLAANYLAIVVTPVVVDFFRGLFHAADVRAFSFIFNFVLSGLFVILVLALRRSFVFRMDSASFSGK